MRETTFGCAETSRNQRRLAVVTCFFNWAGFSRKTANLRRFLLQMQAQGVPVFGVEAVLPGQAASTQGFDGWERVPANERNIMFQKEALLNRAVSLVPDSFDKIAWLDADVWFENSGWYECTEMLLNNYPVVQLYDSAKWLNQNGSIELQTDSIAKWNTHGRKGPVSAAHTGFAWAARRDLWRHYGGLFANCITGSGDVYASIAFCGIDPEQHPLLATDRQRLNADFKRWAWKIKEWTGGKIGYVPGTIYHEWHGTRRDRNYVKRHAVCSQIAKGDVLLNEHGIFEWAETAKTETIAAVKSYFIERREDGSEQSQSLHLAAPAAASVGNTASVVVTTHPGYIEFLDRTLGAIDKQSVSFGQKILVLDGFETPPFDERPGWTLVRSNAQNPNTARNAGLAQVVNEWVIFWDGDNTMPGDYHAKMLESRISASHKTAFIYPSIDYVDAAGAQVKSLEVPEYDYWLLRERTFVDTSSLWNAVALRSVGGWIESQPKYDDYALAMLLTRRGWQGMKSMARTSITRHSQRRSSITENNAAALWNARTLAVATVWGPENDESASALLNWMTMAELPPNTHVYWLDNSGSPKTRAKLDSFARNLRSVTIIDGGRPFDMSGKTHRAIGRHEHVANLYNVLLPQISEDIVCLIEDDNIGPLDGVKRICEPLLANSSVAGVGGIYRSRSNPQRAAASLDSRSWKSPLIADVKPELIRAGMLGGGFTVYANWALRRCLPCHCTVVEGSLLGWDANIGIEMGRNGCDLLLHGGVEVDHRCPEVIEHLGGKISRAFCHED